MLVLPKSALEVAVVLVQLMNLVKMPLARATLEATCFQTKAILDAMEKDAEVKLSELAVDGGMSGSDLCMQVCA